jgi:hypothetical protein
VDFSTQKRAVLMYTDKKLVFYGLSIKSLLENLKKKIPPHRNQNGYPEEKQ